MKLIAVDIGSTYAKCAVLRSHNGIMLEKAGTADARETSIDGKRTL